MRVVVGRWGGEAVGRSGKGEGRMQERESEGRKGVWRDRKQVVQVVGRATGRRGGEFYSNRQREGENGPRPRRKGKAERRAG